MLKINCNQFDKRKIKDISTKTSKINFLELRVVIIIYWMTSRILIGDNKISWIKFRNMTSNFNISSISMGNIITTTTTMGIQHPRFSQKWNLCKVQWKERNQILWGIKVDWNHPCLCQTKINDGGQHLFLILKLQPKRV